MRAILKRACCRGADQQAPNFWIHPVVYLISYEVRSGSLGDEIHTDQPLPLRDPNADVA